MSGGHFDYGQSSLSSLAESIREEIQKFSDDGGDEWGRWEKLPDEILQEMKEVEVLLDELYERVHDIDWFLSGDYGEDTFLKLIRERRENGNKVLDSV